MEVISLGMKSDNKKRKKAYLYHQFDEQAVQSIVKRNNYLHVALVLMRWYEPLQMKSHIACTLQQLSQSLERLEFATILSSPKGPSQNLRKVVMTHPASIANLNFN